jgi:hypothetical protein
VHISRAEAKVFAAGLDLEGNWGLTKDELEAMFGLQAVGHSQTADGGERIRLWRLIEADDVSLAKTIAEGIPDVSE